jgi:hypothetical protein
MQQCSTATWAILQKITFFDKAILHHFRVMR